MNKYIVSVLILTFVCCIPALAQSPEGALVGVVVDATGARVAGAAITASAKNFSLVRTAKSSKVGEFTIESLPPGAYEVKVEAPGFAPKSGTVTVAVTSTPTLTVTLQPASSHETVSVKGSSDSLTAAPIETSSSVMKTTIGVRD